MHPWCGPGEREGRGWIPRNGSFWLFLMHRNLNRYADVDAAISQIGEHDAVRDLREEVHERA